MVLLIFEIFCRASLASEAKESDEKRSETKMSASVQDLQLPITPLKSPVSSYWIFRKDSLELIELSSINKVSLV